MTNLGIRVSEVLCHSKDSRLAHLRSLSTDQLIVMVNENFVKVAVVNRPERLAGLKLTEPDIRRSFAEFGQNCE